VSYNALDTSVQDSSPLYRFLFVVGGIEYRFTSASFFSEDSDGTWTPIAIDHTSISQSGDLGKDSVRITLPRTDAFAGLFLGTVPEQQVSLTIFRFQGDFFEVEWKGRIAGTSATGDAVTLECENIFTSMRRPGLRARYQKGCRHALYSPRCGVDRAAFADAATVISSSGFSVIIELDSNQRPDGYYAGGMIEIGTSLKYIIAHQGGVLTLMQPIEIDSDGQVATLYPGCAHNLTACKNKFNNLLNYGGFPWIPGDRNNPFGNGITGSVV
jgi:uncharacterized phage protein (TIGR02218 family)